MRNLLKCKNHEKTSCIYGILNLKNKKLYIGSTKSYYYRIALHNSHLKRGIHANRYLQRSYDKYGNDNFYVFIIEIVTSDVLILKEKYWMDLLKPEYNLVANPQATNIPTKEYRKKISDTLKEGYASGRINKYPHKTTNIPYDIYSFKNEFLFRVESLGEFCRKFGFNYYTVKSNIKNNKIFWHKGYILTTPGISPEDTLYKFISNREILGTKIMNLGLLPILHITNSEVVYYDELPFTQARRRVYNSINYVYKVRPHKTCNKVENAKEGYFTFLGLYKPV